jgi:sugar lactone lactonase YvrE
MTDSDKTLCRKPDVPSKRVYKRSDTGFPSITALMSLRRPQVTSPLICRLLLTGILCAAGALQAQIAATYAGAVVPVVSGSRPYGMKIDGSRNIYFADTLTKTVQKAPWTGSGYGPAVAVMARGSSTSSSFDPQSVALDGGTLFVSDYNDGTGLGVIWSAGYPLHMDLFYPLSNYAGYLFPAGLQPDGKLLYVADLGGWTMVDVLILDPNTTCHGAPCGEFLGWDTISTDVVLGPGGAFYFTRYTGTVTGVYKASGGYFNTASTVYEASQADFQPRFLAVDADSNVYFTGGNGLLSEAAWSGSSYGSPLTLLSSAQYGGFDPTGVALDGSGNIFVGDAGSGYVLELTKGAPNFPVTNVGDSSPFALINFSFGLHVTLANTPYYVVTQGVAGADFVDVGSSSCTAGKSYNFGDTCSVHVRFSPKGAGLRTGAVLLKDSNGKVIATARLSGTGSGPETVFLPASTATLASTSLNGTGFRSSAVAVDAGGNVYISDAGNGAVIKRTPSGSETTLIDRSTSGFSNLYASAIAMDGAGNLFVADAGGLQVAELPWNGSSYGAPAVLLDPAMAGSSFQPYGVALDTSGNLFVADFGGRQILEMQWNPIMGYLPIASPVVTVSSSGFSALQPMGVAVDAGGNLVIVDTGDNLLLECPLANGTYGGAFALEGPVSGLDHFRPFSAALDGVGNVYIADAGDAQVLELPWTGSGFGPALTLATGNPGGVAVDPSGNVYYSDLSAHTVLELKLASAPSLDFGSVPWGESSVRSTLTVNNIGNAGLTFSVPSSGTNPAISTGFQLTGGNCPQLSPSSSPQSLAAGTICTYWVEFVPQGSGPESGSLVLRDNNLNLSGASQTIALSGIGVVNTTTTAGSASTTYSASAQSVNLSATVTSGKGTVNVGTVTFTVVNGGTTIGTATTSGTVSNGAASVSYSLPAGTAGGVYTIQARYDATGGVFSDSAGSGTLTVNKKAATVSLGSLTQTYNGSQRKATATTNPTGLNVTFTYDGLGTAPTAVGSYAVVGTISDTNYQGSASGTLTVNQATAIVTLSNLTQLYTGSPRPATATTTPAGLAVTITYDGNSTAPAAVGSYAVVATVIDQNYQGSAAGTLVIFPPANFGARNIGSSSAAVAVTLVFSASTTLSGTTPYRALTRGAEGMDFAPANGGSCQAGQSYPAGQSCTVKVVFTPKFPGLRDGAVVAVDSSGGVAATTFVQGSGVGAQLVYGPGSSGMIASGLYYPYGVAVDAAQNVYIADTNNSRVVKLTPGPGGYTLTTVGASWNGPWRVAVDGAGSLYVTDYVTGTAYKLAWNGTTYSARSPLVTGLSYPAGIAVDGAGNVYVVNQGANLIVEVPWTGNGYGATVNLGAGSISSPTGVAVDGSGNLYVAEYVSTTGVGDVVKLPWSASGYGSPVEVGGGWQARAPYSVALDGGGNVYVADDLGAVVKVPWTGSGYGAQSVLYQGGHPAGLAVDGSGNVYFDDIGAGKAYKLDLADAPSLSFGSVNAGVTSAAQTVTLANIGNTALNIPVPSLGNNPILSAGYLLGGGTTCPQLSSASPGAGTLAAGASCTYALEFSPSVPGSDPGSLVLTDNNLNVGGATQSIALSGTGTGSNTATVAAAASAAYSPAAQSVALTASVTSGGGTVNAGTVTFSVLNGSTPIGTATTSGTVSNGSAAVGYTLPAGTAVGSYTIQAVFNPGGGFFGSSGTGTLTVNKATPALNWSAPAAIPYGTPLGTTQLNATANGLAGTLTYTPATGAVLAAGSRTLSVTFTPSDAANYTQATAQVTLQVNKLNASVTPNAATKVYGQPDPALSGALSGFLPSDNVTASYSRTAGESAAGSPYAIGATLSPGAALANYNITYNTAAFAITRAFLTVMANNASRPLGGTNPVFTVGYGGFVNNDTATVLSGAPALSTSATISSPVGSYPIAVAPGTLAAANYTFTFANGTLTVLPAPTAQLVVTASLAKLSGGGFQATVLVTNNGTAAAVNAQIGAATLGAASGSPLPGNLGTIAAGGGSAQVVLTFPASAGVSGGTVVQKYSGAFTGGTFAGTFRVTLP